MVPGTFRNVKALEKKKKKKKKKKQGEEKIFLLIDLRKIKYIFGVEEKKRNLFSVPLAGKGSVL